jgi:uncharacterized protein (DUF885 family)
VNKLLVLPAIVLLAAAGCHRNVSQQFERMSGEFVRATLSFSPSGATSVGLHRFEGRNLDDELDDISSSNLDKQLHYYQAFQKRLADVDARKLAAEDRTDLEILNDQVAAALLDLTESHSAQHNPTIYVETLGNALFGPFVLEYAPLPERIRHIIARLGAVPLFLDQASTNLASAPDIWTKVAIDENEGNIALVDKTIRAAVPAELAGSYKDVAGKALQAMGKFQQFLKNDLLSRTDWDWRLGRDRYARKFSYTLETGVDAETLLQNATNDLAQVRAHMLELALPLHRQMVPSHGDHAELSGQAREDQVIGEVLATIAQHHSTRESYMDDARRDLEEARAFVAQKHLLTLPARGNLQVIPTPEFMRGIYAVGGFDPAPPLEPKLGAFYWVTPIPDTWPKDRVESKLREYNFYKLKLLTIHEAMPGHYVQFEFANDIPLESRRLVRAVFGNGPYVEGWAQYAEQMLLDEGFLDRSPEMALTFAKERLRVIANAILDIRLQMLNMSDQDALDLMEKQTFQETEEAAAKLQRAKLSSCQLPTYYAGWNGWLAARAAYRNAAGASYSLSQFNDRALGEGAVPLRSLAALLQESKQNAAGQP